MIVYRSDKAGFLQDVDTGEIDRIIEASYKKNLQRRTSQKEVESWWNSLHFMSHIMFDPGIPSNAGVVIECQIPQTTKRIDFIITGQDEANINNVVIVELKQWTSSERTDKDAIVKTALGRGLHETSHPSYQAWSYAALLEDFSETVFEENIQLKPCAYLHNYEQDEVIRHPFYSEYIGKAPVFLKREAGLLKDFIKKFIRTGDKGELMYRIDKGRIRPSKQLADSLVTMIKGNRAFILLDDQKLVFETALNLTERAKMEGKKVFIIEGGPGTGKSVVAINLLVEITRRGMLTQYVTKNAAPRAVYESKLSGTLKKSRFAALFQGSGRFVDAKPDIFDALVVDEAHRLNEKSGLYQNMGENQIKEIIRAARCAIFFIDENQRVTLKDIGTKAEISKWAAQEGAEIEEMELASQFRCNGSDGYLAFIDDLLQIRETANVDLEGLNFDFRVMDSPAELRKLIIEKNQEKNAARLVAGYCWDWKSKSDPHKMDIVFPEDDFAMKWNLTQDAGLWIMQPNSINEVGCIHTCQGLETDYIGVIIGPDLIVRNNKVLVDPAKRSKMDKSIFGYKKLLELDKGRAEAQIRLIIKNTYRTLMTRGMKGCYLYCTDAETNQYFKDSLKSVES